MLEFADLTEWWIEVSSDIQTESWQQSQLYGTPNRRWVAYLNQICLNVFVPWLREISIESESWFSSSEMPAIWELVNGTAVTVGNSMRFVLIPGETIDDGELEVPQEWVDIPRWTADYYLAVQVREAIPETSLPTTETWLRVWGYTTHQELKENGNYDPNTRMYTLDEEYLTRNLNNLWMTYEMCPEEPTQTTIAPLPVLPIIQAENLIQRLSHPSITFPRLAVPFTLWAGLLEQETWRQRLCQQRQLARQSDSVTLSSTLPVQLRQWFQNLVEVGWHPVEDVALQFRANVEASDSEVSCVKRIDWNAQTTDRSVLLVIRLNQEVDEQIKVLVQVFPDYNVVVPPNLTLSLCSETGDILQSVQARSQDNYIQLRPFRCTVGTHFSLQVVLGVDCFNENFVV